MKHTGNKGNKRFFDQTITDSEISEIDSGYDSELDDLLNDKEFIEDSSGEHPLISPREINTQLCQYGYDSLLKRRNVLSLENTLPLNVRSLLDAKAKFNVPWLYFITYFTEFEKKHNLYFSVSQSTKKATELLDNYQDVLNEEKFRDYLLAKINPLPEEKSTELSMSSKRI